jgi:hypothetical protein
MLTGGHQVQVAGNANGGWLRRNRIRPARVFVTSVANHSRLRSAYVNDEGLHAQQPDDHSSPNLGPAASKEGLVTLYAWIGWLLGLITFAAIALRSRYANPPPDLDSFFCEFCGAQKPRRQMKEVFLEQPSGTTRKELCPSCLDELLEETNHREAVRGCRKQRAALFPKSSWPTQTDRAAGSRAG